MIKGFIIKNSECETIMFHNFPYDFSDIKFKELATNYFYDKDINNYKCFKDPKLDDRAMYIDENRSNIILHGNIDYHVDYSEVEILFNDNIKSVYLFKFICPYCDETLFVFTNDDIYECWNCGYTINLENMKPINKIINKNYKK